MNVSLGVTHVEHGKTELNSHMDIKRNPTKHVFSLAGTTQGYWMDQEETIAGLMTDKKCHAGRPPDPGWEALVFSPWAVFFWSGFFFSPWVPCVLTLTEP